VLCIVYQEGDDIAPIIKKCMPSHSKPMLTIELIVVICFNQKNEIFFTIKGRAGDNYHRTLGLSENNGISVNSCTSIDEFKKELNNCLSHLINLKRMDLDFSFNWNEKMIYEKLMDHFLSPIIHNRKNKAIAFVNKLFRSNSKSSLISVNSISSSRSRSRLISVNSISSSRSRSRRTNDKLNAFQQDSTSRNSTAVSSTNQSNIEEGVDSSPQKSRFSVFRGTIMHGRRSTGILPRNPTIESTPSNAYFETTNAQPQKVHPIHETPFLSRSQSVGKYKWINAFIRPKISTCQVITKIIKIINRKHIHSKKLYIIDGAVKDVNRIFRLLTGL
jgi:hypothetical protein